MALRKPTFCPATYTNATETTTISRNGAHQAALRRRSVKVFDGAMNVLMMRAPSESGAGWETGDLGKTGEAVIDVSFEVRWNSSRQVAWRQATTRLRFLHAECDTASVFQNLDLYSGPSFEQAASVGMLERLARRDQFPHE